MFEQYCIPELLQSSVSSKPLGDLTHTLPEIKELLYVQQQTELIQKIFSKMNHHSKTSIMDENNEDQFQNELEMSIMKRSGSTGNIYSLSCDLVNFTFNHQDRLKFASNASKCLKEIKDNCSLETYQYFSKMIEENRKLTRNIKLRAKDQKRIDFLEEQKLILQQQVQKEKECIENLKGKIDKLAKQNTELTKKIERMSGEEKRLLKKEESILYQRKVCSSLQKEIRQEMLRLEELWESMEQKSEKQTVSNSSTSGDEGEEDKVENISDSTIDCHGERPEMAELWKLLNRLEALSESSK